MTVNSAELVVIRDLMRRLNLSYVEVRPPVDVPADLVIEHGVNVETDALYVKINGDDPLPDGVPRGTSYSPPQNWLEMIAALGLGAARIGVLIIMIAAVVRLTVSGVQWVWSLGGICN